MSQLVIRIVEQRREGAWCDKGEERSDGRDADGVSGEADDEGIQSRKKRRKKRVLGCYRYIK